MSDLLSDKPKHRPIPNFQHFPELRGTLRNATIGVGFGAAFVGMCPAEKKRHDHVPEQEYVEVLRPVSLMAVNSTTPGTPFFGNVFDAADAAIQASYRKRNAQFWAAMVPSSNTAFLLQDDEDNGAKLDWLPSSSSGLL